MGESSYFRSKGLPEPPASDRRGSGLPKPEGDFGQTFEHLYEASLVSALVASTEVLRGLLPPPRAGLSAEKILGKAIAAFVTCFTVRRFFHYLRAKRRKRSGAVLEKPIEGNHLTLARSA